MVSLDTDKIFHIKKNVVAPAVVVVTTVMMMIIMLAYGCVFTPMKAKNCFRLFRKKKKVPKIRELLGGIREIVLFAVYVSPNPKRILFPQ